MPALYEPHPIPDLCAWCARVATVRIVSLQCMDPACDEHAEQWAFRWLGETTEPIGERR